MSIVWHIVRKDLRRIRWLLTLWIVVVVTGAALSMRMVSVVPGAPDWMPRAPQVDTALTMLQLLLGALIVARVVHEEPLVGLRAFWLTRPYDRGTLFWAKVLLVVLSLAGLSLLTDVVTMARLGADASTLLTGGSAAAIVYVGGVLSLMAIAVLTASLGSFVLTMVSVIACSIVVTLGMATFGGYVTGVTVGPFVPLAFSEPDSSRRLTLLAVFLCAMLGVIIYQYRHRRGRVAAAIAVASLVFTATVPRLWARSIERDDTGVMGAWAANATVVYDGTTQEQVEETLGSRPAARSLNAHVTLSGMPPSINVQRVDVRGTLRFAEGAALRSTQTRWLGPPFRPAAVDAALDGARVLNPPNSFEQPWLPMVTLSDEQFTRTRGRSGLLEASLEFHLVETHQIGVLPLKVGATLDDGTSGIAVLGIGRRSDGRNVYIRQWRARSVMSPAPSPAGERLFVLRQRMRDEALMGRSTRMRGFSRGNMATGLGIPLGLLNILGGVRLVDVGFSAESDLLQFPWRGFGEAPTLGTDWFDDAELVVLETRPIGVLTRPLTISGFTVPQD